MNLCSTRFNVCWFSFSFPLPYFSAFSLSSHRNPYTCIPLFTTLLCRAFISLKKFVKWVSIKKTLVFFFAFLVFSGKFGQQSFRFRASNECLFWHYYLFVPEPNPVAQMSDWRQFCASPRLDEMKVKWKLMEWWILSKVHPCKLISLSDLVIFFLLSKTYSSSSSSSRASTPPWSCTYVSADLNSDKGVSG